MLPLILWEQREAIMKINRKFDEKQRGRVSIRHWLKNYDEGDNRNRRGKY